MNLAYSSCPPAASDARAPALEVRDLCVTYPGTKRTALHHIDLRVEVGARLALVGANGAGKSTLLKAIAGLLPIRRGEIAIYGSPVGACHQRVAYLSQRGEIDWGFPISLRRLVMTGRYVHLGWLRRPSQADHALVDAAIAQLGLTDLADRQIGHLSGGQQQRALVARVLAQGADLLLLDEPLNAVDAETRALIRQVLAGLSKQGRTIVTATHDLARLERDFDDVLYLSQGRASPGPLAAIAPGALAEPRIGVLL